MNRKNIDKKNKMIKFFLSKINKMPFVRLSIWLKSESYVIEKKMKKLKQIYIILCKIKWFLLGYQFDWNNHLICIEKKNDSIK